MKPPEPTGPAPAPSPREATVVVIKIAGRYKAIVGAEIEYGDYATVAARAAGAKHFKVAESQIEVDPIDARLTVRVKDAS